MKKTIVAAMLLVITTGLFAQQNAVTKYFSDYAQDDRFTKITISGAMFQLATHIDAETAEEQEFKDAVSRIEGMVVLVCDSCAGNERAMYASANDRLPSSFEELMLVEEEDTEVRFTIRESNGVIQEMLVAVGSVNDFVLVDIWGEIDLNQVRKLTSSFDVEAMNAFDPKVAQAALQINYFPNPVRKGANGTLKVTEEMLGATCSVHSSSGQLIREMQITDLTTEIVLSGLQEGTYVLNLKKDNKRMFVEKIVITN